MRAEFEKIQKPLLLEIENLKSQLVQKDERIGLLGLSCFELEDELNRMRKIFGELPKEENRKCVASKLPQVKIAEKKCETKILECGICFHQLQDPQTLPCFHSYCSNCLNQLTKGSNKAELKCPLCHQTFSLSNRAQKALSNEFVKEASKSPSLPANPEDVKCQLCEKERPASHYCMNDEEFMCDGCTTAHKRSKASAQHKIVTLKEYFNNPNQGEKILRCSQHPTLELTTYCTQCKMPICLQCIPISHSGHPMIPLEQEAAKAKNEITQSIAKMKEVRNKVIEANELVKLTCDALESNQVQSEKEMGAEIEELRRGLDERQAKLLQEMQELKDQADKELALQNQDLEFVNNSLEAAIVFGEELLNQGTFADIISNKPLILQRHQTLLNLLTTSSSSPKMGNVSLKPVKTSNLSFSNQKKELVIIFVNSFGIIEHQN
jgi:tripartite motif-containing protein 56